MPDAATQKILTKIQERLIALEKKVSAIDARVKKLGG
jgi:hypothetical protein